MFCVDMLHAVLEKLTLFAVMSSVLISSKTVLVEIGALQTVVREKCRNLFLITEI